MNAPLKEKLRPYIPPAMLSFVRRARGMTVVPTGESLLTLPMAALEEVFPGADGQTVSLPASQIVRRRDMVLPLVEVAALAAICKTLAPRRILEIGTFTGASTLVMAMNTPAETEIFTLDLSPAQRDEYARQRGIQLESFEVGAVFRAAAVPLAYKIRQLYGDSRSFDFAELAGSVDLVFIDADHSYECVRADTETALGLVRRGGAVVWDDYASLLEFPECEGVARYLGELAKARPCVQLRGTRFAALRT